MMNSCCLRPLNFDQMTSMLKREPSQGPTKFEETGFTIFSAVFKIYSHFFYFF